MFGGKIREMCVVPLLFLVDVVSALLLRLVVEHLHVYRTDADPRLFRHLCICDSLSISAAVIMCWVFLKFKAWSANMRFDVLCY